ncbi:MAG: lytic murein transglycosylase, partial [Elusimicrobia bacterium]|nr:lytic murein transglycosylase [Elusimicrobiota bacterium]
MESGSRLKVLLLTAAAAGLTVLVLDARRGPQSASLPLIGAMLGAPARSASAPAAAARAEPNGERILAGPAEAGRAPVLEPPPPGEGPIRRAWRRALPPRLSRLGPGLASGSSGTAARYVPADPYAPASPDAPAAAPAGSAASAPAPSAPGPSAPAAGEPGRQRPGRGERLAQEAETAGLSKDERLSANVADVLSEARDLKISQGGGQAALEEPRLAAAILGQIESDRKVAEGVRGALARLKASGRPVEPQERRQAAAEFLAASGRGAQEADVDEALALAEAPPLPAVGPGVYAEAARQVVADPPDARTRAEILKRAEEPKPAPRAPPPRGALDAYQKNRTVFDRALKEYGVQPQHILGILGVETTWGR